jgi:hypothetical protein
MPSSDQMTSGGISCAQLSIVSSRGAHIIHFVNSLRGSLIALTQSGCSEGYAFLAVPLVTNTVNIQSLIIQQPLFDVVPSLTSTSLDHCCYHTSYPGPIGHGGLLPLAVDPSTGTYID